MVVAAVELATPVVLRPMVPGDRNCVLDSWLRSHHRRWFGSHLSDRAYSRGQRNLVEALLARCAVLVAAFDEDPDTILGWSCTSTCVVHYVWVRHEFRRRGIASQLLAPYLHERAFYTHPPTSGDVPVPPTWYYNPYAAFELAYAGPQP